MNHITIKKKTKPKPPPTPHPPHKKFLTSQHAFILQLPGLSLVCLNGSLRTKKILRSRPTTFSASGAKGSSDHNIHHTLGHTSSNAGSGVLESLVVFGNVHAWWARREARLLTSLYSSHLEYFRCSQRLLMPKTCYIQTEHVISVCR